MVLGLHGWDGMSWAGLVLHRAVFGVGDGNACHDVIIVRYE